MSSDLRQRKQPAPSSASGKEEKPAKKVKSPHAESGLGCGTLLKIGLVLFLVLPISMFILYIYIVPEDKYPIAFVLPDPPSLEVNNQLFHAERLFEDKIYPAEMIIHHNGDLYSGLLDGRVVRISKGEVQTIAKFGRPPCGGFENEPHCGTPLGLRFDNDGFLIVCDAYLGLFKVNVATDIMPCAGDVQLLLPSSVLIDGRSLMFLNNLDIDRDGMIYMSDSRDIPFNMFDGRPTGRLLRYDPIRNTTEVLLDRLAFANGVQLSRYGDYVLVAETFRARIIKYHLKGSKAGTSEVFADNLPVLPDNIRPSSNGGYWTCGGMMRFKEKTVNMFDLMGPRPWIRKILSWMPAQYWLNMLNMDPHGSILIELNRDGKIVRSLMDYEGKTVKHSSDVCDVQGVLYIGSYLERYIAKIDSNQF